MNFFLLQLDYSLVLTSIATLLLGIFVYNAIRGEDLGKVFLLYCLSISWWSFFHALHQTSINKEISIAAARLMTAGGSFLIPTLFVHFVITLLEIQVHRKFLLFLYLLSLAFAALSTTPYMVVDAVPKFYLTFFLVPGPAYLVGVLFFL